ncbi:MAG: hypothetical protein Q7K35_04760 [bacterium]|nr:hypothetical protein [bacterium]
MKKLTTVVVALAALGLATYSALGQTITCVERVVNGTGANWYASENHVAQINGTTCLIYDPGIMSDPRNLGTYPIVNYILSSPGGPFSDSYSGTNVEFRLPAQAPGVELQVHYQVTDADWAVGETTVSSNSQQVVRCPRLNVPQGGAISFVIRVKIEDWVPDGTQINIERLNTQTISGLIGKTLGHTPEVDVITYTGPWEMTWWKRPILKSVSRNGNVSTLTVQSPPHFWDGNWKLKRSTDLKVWTTAATTLVDLEPGQDGLTRLLKVDATVPHEFYTFAFETN